MPYEGLDFVQGRTELGIPLVFDDVSWDVYMRPDEIGPNSMFPPNRFRERDERIQFLTGLWQGNLADVDLGPNPVICNQFYGYSTKLANLLLMSEPEASGVDQKLLADMAFDALIDLTRYGGAILLDIAGELSVQAPSSWYPTMRDGDFFVKPYVSDMAQAFVEDRVDILWVHSDGRAERAHSHWDHGAIGSRITNESLGAATMVIVPRDPRNGIWGTAKYLEMFSLVAEISKRYSTNSRVLDIFTKPIPTFTMSDADAQARFGTTDDDTAAERREKILEGQLGMVMEETIHLEDDLMSLDYAQPATTGVMHAVEQINVIMEDLRSIAGLPNLQGQVLSGEALKRLFVHFYAETKAMQNSVRSGLEELLGRPVVWEHVFDNDTFSAKVEGGESDGQNEGDQDADEAETDSDQEGPG